MGWEKRPHWTKCSVYGCRRPTLNEATPYCDMCVPISGFISNEQLALARTLLKRGANIYQASVRLKVDPRDLDLALWKNLGLQKRQEPMFQ